MKCPGCHHLNPIDAKFCVECGAVLPRGCPSCGQLNPVQAKFCGKCGQKLTALAASRDEIDATPAHSSDPATGSPERRQLTVMFCDLVGSTGLSARLDPEDLRNVIGAYRHGVADAVERFEGFIARYMGDGVLVYFGYPLSHEDNAERAVRAGLAAVAVVESLSTGAGMRLQARVGIATGLVVVGGQIGGGETQEVDVTGETPNLAAKLQTAAEPGEVVIAASTRRLVGRLFDCRALGSIEVKGLPQPVEAWQVLGETTGVSRFEALHVGALSPLVGRQEEIELLLRRWNRAKAGEGRVVLLAGEPGIGKSRIAESLLIRLEHEPHVRLRYFCSPHHKHSAFYPFITQIERSAGFDLRSHAAETLDKLEALLRPMARTMPQDLALIAELLSVPADGRYPTVEVSPQQKRQMTLAALLHQLEGMAALKPVLIVLEDAHWIDPTSLDLLDRMIARIPDLPVLLLITFRPELQQAWVGQPHVTLLSLSRLGRRDSVGVIAGITKGKVLPDPVAEQILARTDGVPLFIEELTSTLLESGLLRETEDRFMVDGTLPPIAIPTTLQASLVARLDRLASVKDVAQIGAVIGREFSHELIAAVSTLPPAELDAALDRLTVSGLISRRGATASATYSFKHALVQDAAYATLLKSRREQLHASIAKALVERLPKLAESLPEIVAHHFAEAGLAGEAIAYWRRAGQRAGARSANREAVTFFEQALGLLDALPESRGTLEQAYEIRLALRQVLIQLGAIERMLDRLREAEALAERLNDDGRRGRAWAFMTSAHSLLGELDEAAATGTRALEIATRIGDTKLHILTTSYLEQVHYYRGDHERVVELATHNLVASPADWVDEHSGTSASPWVLDRNWLVICLAELGRFVEAAEQEVELIRFAESTHHAFTRCLAYSAAGTLHRLKGDWTKALPFIEHAIRVVRESNIVFLLPSELAASAWVEAQLGETSEAQNMLQQSEELIERLAARTTGRTHSRASHSLGRALFLLGRLDEAWSLCERAIQSSPLHLGFVAHALHLLGDIATHPDRLDTESGEAHYRQALALAEPRGMRPLVAHCHFGLGKLYWRTANREQAREHLTTATAMYREMDMSFWLEQAETEMRQPR